MKIGLDARPVRGAESYAFRLDELLPKYASEHEYVVDSEKCESVDMYHSFKYVLPDLFSSHRVPRVVTVYNLNFLRYPHLYSLSERIRRYLACRTADRILVLGNSEVDELAGHMGIDRRKIEVVLPLAASPPLAENGGSFFEAIRAKYDLPDQYMICLGAANPHARYRDLFDVMMASDAGLSLVVCGRRTPWSDELLAWAREHHKVNRIEFIYEFQQDDLPALLRMSRGFFRLHGDSGGEAVAPLVGAMRAGVPLVLSDMPRHREVAEEAAHYVAVDDRDTLAAAFEALVADAGFREELAGRSARRAELFSEAAVAQRISAIYASL